MKKLLLFLFVISYSISINAQDFAFYKKKIFILGKDTLPYRLLLPENFDATKKYPLVLFLHGRGECGSDNEKQLTHGASLFLRDSIRKKYPAIILFPQCTWDSYWSNVDIKEDSITKIRTFNFSPSVSPTVAMNLTEKLLTQIQKDFLINKKQVYVLGLSMGGMGTFEIVRRNPTLFAASIPICGGANASTARLLKKTSWWIFHGAKDDVVNPEFSKQMYQALKAVKANVKFTLYPDANHNSWDSAFAEPAFMSWLFTQHK